MNKIGKTLAVAGLVFIVGLGTVVAKQKESSPEQAITSKRLPRLVDLGADKCIPCKMMAPILKELKSTYAGRMEVEFIDVWKNRDKAKEYRIRMIPTQIFYDSAGKELVRHEGFIGREDILAKWKQFGVNLGGDTPKFSRLDPLAPDTRPGGTVCYMCDTDINLKTRVTLKTDKGNVYLCGPHCYFITYSSLLERQGIEEKISVTDWSTGRLLAQGSAAYLYGMEESGRPTIKAFADKQAALQERRIAGGNILSWEAIRAKELGTRCGFCDRAVYPEDAASVKANGLHTWGCCAMCALGVAARTKEDIEVFQKDALTGRMVHVKTTNGSISLLEPETAVAWSGKRKLPDGKLVSAGCFKQAFFVNEENLKKWVEQHPTATGMMIPIDKALAAKMKLSPKQISKACKIGECAPR